MCPFCISALAVAAAKTLSAAGGGGALVAKLAHRKRAHVASNDVNPPQSSIAAAEGSQSTPGAVIAASSGEVDRAHFART